MVFHMATLFVDAVNEYTHTWRSAIRVARILPSAWRFISSKGRGLQCVQENTSENAFVHSFYEKQHHASSSSSQLYRRRLAAQ
jgi:hypothetical protein